MTSTLMIHMPGSRIVTLDELRQLPTPAPQGPRHFPVSHSALVGALLDQCAERSWQVTKLQLGTSAKGKQLFGTIDVRGESLESPDDQTGTTIGFRSSTDKTLAVRGVAGARVFCCDNLCLSGSEFAFHRKHTRYLDLPALVNGGLDRFTHECKVLKDDIIEMQQTDLKDWQAKVRMFDLSIKTSTMPKHLMQDVSRAYFEPEKGWTDCQGRTVWSLNNACTRSLGKLSPKGSYDCAQRIGRHFKAQAQRGDFVYYGQPQALPTA